MYNEKELKNYLNTLTLKQNYINESDHSRRFIITYSNYQDNSTYLTHLEKSLKEKGYSFFLKTNEEIFKTLMQTDTENYFSKFIFQIIIPFISIFKQNNYHLEDLNELYELAPIELKKQLIVLKPILNYYQKELKKKHYIDFDDMINLAYEIIPTMKEENLGVDYDYLIIDEYQDISNQRYNLTKVLADLFQAKIMAVGDDWQTIYSFAGASINLFTEFQKHIDSALKFPIKNTYRNSQELIDIAGEFIKRNQHQIKKELVSTKHLANPIEIFIYDDINKYTVSNNHAKAITEIITKITKNNPKHQILLLGRYKKDKETLLATDYFLETRGKIKAKVNEKANLNFLTIHKAKRLSADSVILLNAIDDLLGFPFQIEDIPIIKLLKNANNHTNQQTTKEQLIPYPEERRLFYVAMTGTKNKFYIAVPKSKKSVFVKEISRYNNIIIHKDIIKYNSPINTNKTCPKCNHPLIMVNYQNKDFYIYKCKNTKCTFQTMFPNKLEELEICPKCKSIVIYQYTNSQNQRIYKCFNRNCNYHTIKENDKKN